MDLGKEALGNYKAEEGGCSQTQVRSRSSHLGATGPMLREGTIIQFFNGASDLRYANWTKERPCARY